MMINQPNNFIMNFGQPTLDSTVKKIINVNDLFVN